MSKLRIALVGGGTGGHIYPLIAVSNELRQLSAEGGLILEARYFGGAKDFEEILVNSGIRFVSIISSKFRRYASALNLLDIPKFFFGFFQSLWKIYWFMPDAIFSKGGPGALPIILAGKFYFIPIIIQESDSVPGQTNIFSAKFAKKIFVAFKSAESYFTGRNTEAAGNPIRQDLAEQPQADAKQRLGFDSNLPLLLVLGGSQGATRINAFILENLQQLVRQFQILHQIGERNYETYESEYKFLTKDWSELETRRYQFKPYLENELSDAYSAADLVLARAGAGTIFELAAFGKPAILIPLPEAAGDHQKKNAYEYAVTGAAIVIEQDNFAGNLAISQISQLINNPTALRRMESAAKSFYRPDSAKIIAHGILEYV